MKLELTALFIALTSASPVAQTFSGDGTYYTIGGETTSACALPHNGHVVAINQEQYGNSETCGSCVRITGPLGTIEATVVDRCPECAFGSLDLGEESFPLIADKSAGRVPISWEFIPCHVEGGIEVVFKEGSNAYWFAVQIRNSKKPITGVSLNGQALQRQAYNYFVGSGPVQGGELKVSADGQEISVQVNVAENTKSDKQFE